MKGVLGIFLVIKRETGRLVGFKVREKVEVFGYSKDVEWLFLGDFWYVYMSLVFFVVFFR